MGKPFSNFLKIFLLLLLFIFFFSKKYDNYYSVQINIDKNVEEEWLIYMKNQHIRDVMKTGLFKAYDFLKIREGGDLEETHSSYRIEYSLNNMKDLEEYNEKHAPGLREDHSSKFQGKFTGKRTILEDVN